MTMYYPGNKYNNITNAVKPSSTNAVKPNSSVQPLYNENSKQIKANDPPITDTFHQL